MIEFQGEFSEASKRFLLKENAIVGLVSSLLISIIFGVSIIIIAAIYDYWLITLFMIGFILFIIFATASPYIQKKKTLSLVIPRRICIDKDGKIYVDLEKQSVSKSLSKVRKVVDESEWYYIKFNPPKVDGFLCQKNLITRGTIEEFEQLFEGKIVRINSKR